MAGTRNGAGSRGSSTAGADLLRDAYRWRDEIVSEHGYRVALKITDTGRPGVLLIQWGAFRQTFEGQWEKVARYAVEWPNAHPTTLQGEIFNAVVQLSKLVEPVDPLEGDRR